MNDAKKLSIAIAGASGRMGNMLIEIVLQSPDLQLVGAIDLASSPMIGNDATGFLGKASGINVQADIKAALKDADVLIDFTRPEGTMSHLKACRELGVKLVIGTTGFTVDQKKHECWGECYFKTLGGSGESSLV